MGATAAGGTLNGGVQGRARTADGAGLVDSVGVGVGEFGQGQFQGALAD